MQVHKILMFTLMLFTFDIEAYHFTPLHYGLFTVRQFNGPESRHHSGNSKEKVHFPSPLIFIISPVISLQQDEANSDGYETDKMKQVLNNGHE